MLLGFILGVISTYILLFFIPNMIWSWNFLKWHIFRLNNIWETLKESFLEFVGINRM